MIKKVFLLLFLWLPTTYSCGVNIKCWIEKVASLTADVANKAGEITRLNEARRLLQENLLDNLADEVYEKLQEPLEDVTNIFDLLTTPFGVASLSDDILSLGNTLSVCINDLTGAVFGDIPFPDLLQAVDILDVDFDAIIFELAAIPLLPIKSQIEFVCIDVLDMLTAAIRGTKNIPSLSRRRTIAIVIDERAKRRRFLYENSKCEKDDELCKPSAVPYNEWSSDYDDLVGTASNILSIYLTLAGCFTDTSDQSSYWQTSCSPTTEFIWQTIEFILEELFEHFKKGCELVAGCAADVQSGCQPKVSCGKALTVTKRALKVVKKILWAIGFHNGEIAGAKRAALYTDRFNIIHNQHALKKFAKTEIDAQSGLITTRFNALENDISSLQVYLKREIDAQSGLITTRFNTLANNVRGNITHSLDIMITRFNSLADNLKKNISYTIERMIREFNESSTNINNRFKIELNTLRNGILGTENTVQSSANEEQYTLKQIQNSIDALQADFDVQYPGSSAKEAMKNMAIDKLKAGKYEEEGLIVFRIKPADLYIFGAVFVGLNMVFMVIGNFVLMKCCYGHHAGLIFTAVPKYDYSTSDVEDTNK